MRPLNGEKTHPLSAVAANVLREIARGPLPRQLFNPGVVNRLLREALVELVQMPSPFKSHRGQRIWHLKITESGERAIKRKEQP